MATENRRPFALPTHSELPHEFIRLHPWEAEYLFMIAARARVGIVEIGRLRGGSTFLLACANRSVPIWSIDCAPEDDAALRSLMVQHGVGANVQLLVGDSQQGSFPEISACDLLFVDGDHSYEGCRADLDNHFPRLVPGGQLVLHDSYDGNVVQSAVLDFAGDNDVETIRSPYNIASHWQTSTGSIAHLRKPGASPASSRAAGLRQQAEPPPSLASHQVVHRGRPRRTRVAAILVAACIVAFGVFAVPELLGDWPYDPVGHGSATHHRHAARHSHQLPAAAGGVSSVIE